MEDNPFPDCVLHNSKEGIEHVVEHLLSKYFIKKSLHMFVRPNLYTSNVALRVKRTTCPAKDIKGGVPESIVAKGDAKVDIKSKSKECEAKVCAKSKRIYETQKLIVQT